MTMRATIAAAGVAGALGVALSAVAAHRGGGNLGTAAQFLLIHACAFLAIGLSARRTPLLAAGAAAVAIGVALFCGDLILRDLAGGRLFPMAAPAGGILMIAGWLGIGLSALQNSDRPDQPPDA